MDEEHVKAAVQEHPSLQNQVFDLVIDAEKGSKKRILQDEGIEEAQLIISNLLHRDDDGYSKQMETITASRTQQLARLGLSNYSCLFSQSNATNTATTYPSLPQQT